MHWLTLAILATLSWSLVNNLDKIVVTRFVKSPLTIVVMEGFVGILVAFVIMPEMLSTTIPIQIAVIAIVAGILLYTFNYLYYKALEKSDPTIVAILLQTVPLYTFVWGILFFSETFTLPVYIGAVLILLGGGLATINNNDKAGKLKTSGQMLSAFLIMIPANLLLSINYAIQKYALAFADAQSVFVFGRVGGLLFALFFIFSPTVRTNIKEYISIKRIREWLFFILIELFNLLGVFLITKAYSFGSISLITTITSIQPIFVALISFIIGKFVIFRSSNAKLDELGSYRIISIIFITIGVYLISQ